MTVSYCVTFTVGLL